MYKYRLYLVLILIFITFSLSGQEYDLHSDTLHLSETENKKEPPQFRYSGQLSGWGQFTPDISTKGRVGGRYIPQGNFEIPLKGKKLIDMEASANIFADGGIRSFDNISLDGKIKPYRLWSRFSSAQTEIRFGLQKINFGSAQMFRPLMWFDSMDPRDPLQLTDGVWGGLFRYYTQKNYTFWLWALYGNDKRKGWEILPSSNSFPEFGGRTQIPIPKGEAALTYHFRKAEPHMSGLNAISENRFGFDVRLDITVGLWLESSWTQLNQNIGDQTNQQMLTLGTDYTFAIGNGLNTTFEQFFYSYSDKGFNADNSISFSGLSLSYPFAISDNFSAMIYYDWKNKSFYNFLHWQRQLNHITFYLIGYWNPRQYSIPSQLGSSNRLEGKGLQIMLVWYH